MKCAYCDRPAALVKGSTIYPRRHDLAHLNFWRCKPCDAYVGCHKAGSFHYDAGRKIVHDGTEPFGRMANAELRAWRKNAHAEFDPLWKSGRFLNRRDAYMWLSRQLGISFANCHIGMFDIDGCKAVIAVCRLKP